MKKLITIIIASILLFNFWISFADLVSIGTTATTNTKCWDDVKADTDLATMLQDCEPDWIIDGKSKSAGPSWGPITLTSSSNAGYEIYNAKNKIIAITQKLAILASVLAVWWIVYAAIMLTTAYWDDGKVKKWKDAIKFSVIGFLVVIISQQLVNAIINLIYWISG